MNRFILFISLYAVILNSACHSAKSKNTIDTDSTDIAKGELLFHDNCSGCHNFKQDGIGPDLSGITKTDSTDWLKQFIRNPKSLDESGDAHTKKLLSIYHSIMPSFINLKEEEIDQLISFINQHKGHKKEKYDPLAIKDPIPEKIMSSDVHVGLDLLTKIPASSDKEPLTRISQMNWSDPLKVWFVLDQRGKIYKLVNNKPVIWFDISKWKPDFINQPGLATGLGSFAFHPGYARNGLFYTTHSETAHSKKADFTIPDSIKQTLQWVLCEWKVSKPSSNIFKATCRELMRIDMVAGIHGMQEITFNPLAKPGDEDYGQLYIGVGDGGSVENGFSFLTNHPGKIWGTILRIDPLGKNNRNRQYGIPAKNPYAKNADSNTVREIYADGFRNPNRISWTKNRMMLATNIGQANIEAIDIVLKGRHYGWPEREGKFLMHPDGVINNIYPVPPDDSIYHFTYPAAEYDHSEGNAIAGGFEYQGKEIPELTGKYLFGDIPTGRLFFVNTADLKPGRMAIVKEWFVSLHGKQLSLRELCGQNRVDLRFARDKKGEMYIFTKPDGKIYRLVNNGR